MTTEMQKLLDREVELVNQLYQVKDEIKKLRQGPPPVCWGHDDCSTYILSRCPWRIDCDQS